VLAWWLLHRWVVRVRWLPPAGYAGLRCPAVSPIVCPAKRRSWRSTTTCHRTSTSPTR